MRRAVYARVSTQRQTQMQTIEQQLERLQAHFRLHGWAWQDDCVFRDDGYSGASLKRPGLDRLRDHVSQAHFDRVLMTAPDRLARPVCSPNALDRGTGKRRLPGRVRRATNEPGPPRSIAAADPRSGRRIRAQPDRRSDEARPPAKIPRRHLVPLGTSTLWLSH